MEAGVEITGRGADPNGTDDRAGDTGPPFVLLVDAGSAVERGLIDRWVQQAVPQPAAVLPARVDALTGPLARLGDDAVVTAARVAWLPRERGGVRRVRLADLVTLVNPLRPPSPVQARIARREPDRAAVVVAEPASLGALRARSGGADPSAFAAFVVRQAGLALERAERALLGERYKVPRHVIEAIESRPGFRSEARALAERLHVSEPEVVEELERDLHGMVASMSPVAVDVLSSVGRPLHARAWRVQVDTAGLERLRELNRRHALVFLPSHRSYLDPLVLADVLAAHDFPRNHVLGGDNLSFWPFAPLARRSGIVFIRRSFGDDEIYKFAVREYFAYLLARRFNLEWYMEGGRSRTGKLRPPRYGLLGNVAEAVERGRAEDVHLVPVSIAYDQLREVYSLAAEQLGAPKKIEGVRWLTSYIREQVTQPIGNAHVRFAEPISLHAALEGDADRRRKLQKVAFDVAVGINSVTPVTATALVTLALLGVRDRALTLGQVRGVLWPVRAYVVERGLPRGGDALGSEAGVRRILAALAEQRVITAYTGGEETVYAIERGQHLVAAFYRNTAIHHFVDRAIAELMLLREPADRWDEAARLRDLLKFEFFFPDREVHHRRLEAELDRIDPEWASADGRAVLCRAGFLIAHRVLRSFLDAQLVVAERLAARDPREPVEEKPFLAECAGVGQQMLLQGRLHGPESLSRELFSSALKLADNHGLVQLGLDGPPQELRRRREEFAEGLRDVVARVADIDDIDATARREAVGVEP